MEVNIDEALRYLGAQSADASDLRRRMKQLADTLCKDIVPQYRFRYFDLIQQGDAFLLSGTQIVLAGTSAAAMLRQCSGVVILACTLGVRFDAMLRAQQARDMAESVMLDACGSALVECGCDAAEKEIAARFPTQFLTDRFSPGYGDLPLSLQSSLCEALDAERRLGIHVSSSFLMNPGKSVTAFIGIADQPQPARIRGCAFCALHDTCTFRKGGRHCGD